VSNLTVAGAVAVTLPAGAAKQVFIIVDGKGDAATNNITITPNGAETIRGAATLVLANNYTGVVLVFSGTNWDAFGPFLAPGQVTPADFVGILPVAKGGTGISSFGAGVATWLGTPSSANLASAVTDETGTGALVFANSPTLVTPALGTPASGVLTNATGLPIDGGTINTLPINRGGTGQITATLAFDALSPLTTKGDIVSNDGTNDVRVAVGANGTVLTADSAEAAGVKWGTSAVTPAAGSVYSDGSALQTTGAFAGNGNKVVGVNSGATATEYKSLNTGSSGTDFAIAHAAGSVTFNLPDASATNRGAVTTGAQIFAGVKTFNSAPSIGDASSIVQATASVPGVVSTGAQTFGGTKTFSNVQVYGASPTTNRVSIAQTSGDQTNIPNNASNSYGVYIANGLTSAPGDSSTFRGVEVASHSSQTAMRMHKPGTVEYNMGINSSNELELGNSNPNLAGTSRGKVDSSGNLTITSVTATAVIKSFTGSITSLGNGSTSGFGLTLDNDQVWQISATTTSGDWCCGLAVRCGNFNYMYALGATNLSLNAATTPTISNTSGGTRNVDVTAIRLK
jgi:hypothetical protein